MTSNYQSELETIMMSHFEADSIPCEDFKAIYDAWKAKKVLTESEIRSSLSSVLEDTSDLPDELMTSIVNFLVARQGKKGGKGGKKPAEKPVEKTENKPVEKTENKPAEKKPAEKKPVPVSVVEVPADSTIKQKKAKKSKPASSAVDSSSSSAVDSSSSSVLPVASSSTAEESVLPAAPSVRPLNAVALFSRIVSLIQKPTLSGLAQEEYTLSDGFKPDSKLYTELKEKGVLTWVGQKKTLGDLITSVTVVLQKPAIISVSAVVRWFLPSADQLKIVAAYQALNLPEPERKVKKRKAAKAVEKAAKAVEKAAKPKRVAQGYSLFTQRVGQMMKDPSESFGDERITLTDSQSEAARATALAKGNPAFATVLANHNLKLGTTYQLRELLGLLKESNTTVVRLSGLLWSMSDATTRVRLLAA